MTLVTWVCLVVAVLPPLYAGVLQEKDCSAEGLSISGGNYTLSNGMKPNSEVVYKCAEGYYPSPTTSRHCRMTGRWSPATNIKYPAECKRVTCPDPLVFENGAVSPTQMSYYVTNQTTYECFNGYKQSGPKTRVCKSNGKWSESTPICDRGSGHCNDPGVPPGARRTGHHFEIDDTVTYRCDQGLTLVGSKERVCQENGDWTGAEPACYSKFTYDTTEEVAASFAASLKNSLTTGENETLHGKKIRLNKGANLHIYIALDYSDSIDEAGFEWAKTCTKKLIEQIQYFDITPKYEILAFATKPKTIVSILTPDFHSLDILKLLNDFKYDGKGDKSGTNIAGAFESIKGQMSFLQAQNEVGFKDIQHIIIMFTDGIANMGGSAEENVKKIKLMLNIADKRDDFLDIYVFGIGRDVNEDEINKLVSKKPGERHFFKMDSRESMEDMLNQMIDENDSVGICGMYRDYDQGTKSTKRWRHPWWANVEITREGEPGSNCLGALVSPRFILTAAHCFKITDNIKLVKVTIQDDKEGDSVKDIKWFKPHEVYNSLAKRGQGIKAFYDYDVALIELKNDVKISAQTRPICIPCTVETNRALKLTDKATCKEHEDLLLKKDIEPAVFMDSHGSKRKNVTIKLNQKRPSCIEDVKKAEGVDIKDPKDMVTDNFLCTGGIEGTTDHVACPGDSGGPLFVERRRRLIQVGIVSFGVKNLCKPNLDFYTPDSDSSSRDFHINLFRVLPFLKKYLADGSHDYAPITFID